MKEHPILFSTPMVQAILEGRKSQTRRIMKIQPKHQEVNFGWANIGERWYYPPVAPMIDIKCPYGQPGDILWVRETWQHTKVLNIHQTDENYGYVYKADGQPWEDYEEWTWKPSIFMPREAARIFLRVTDIRAERLQDITEEDVIAEGISLPNYAEQAIKDIHYPDPSDIYSELWESINGKGSWEKNPWVWVIKFERIEKQENETK